MNAEIPSAFTGSRNPPALSLAAGGLCSYRATAPRSPRCGKSSRREDRRQMGLARQGSDATMDRGRGPWV